MNYFVSNNNKKKKKNMNLANQLMVQLQQASFLIDSDAKSGLVGVASGSDLGVLDLRISRVGPPGLFDPTFRSATPLINKRIAHFSHRRTGCSL